MSVSTAPLVLCLMGPTASGKTQLAVELVQRFPLEIISVDSAMVYRGMDIGTAKPTADVLARAPHRLIDIRDPAEIYSAAQFQQDVHREIADIHQHGKIPFLVGGTMLYFSAFQNGLAAMPSADATVRERLNALAAEQGWPFLHAKLQAVDADAAARIHPHDSQRIQRALEVYELTGKTITAWQQAGAPTENPYRIYQMAVSLDRAVLHERIAARFKHMLTDGFLQEVEQLMARGDLTLDMPSMRSCGYRQAWEYLQGLQSYDAFCEKGIIATRQLAKRQLTWLRHWPTAVQLFDSLATTVIEDVSRHVATILVNK